MIIQRPEYVEKLNSWANADDLVKIVTGVRRCGKSYLFRLFQDDLKTNSGVADTQIININLEDDLEIKKIGLKLNTKTNLLEDSMILLDYVMKNLNPDKKNYVFIDEIQRLADWWRVANTLRLRDNVDLYLTGSNAYMFSSDLHNVFGGRFVEIKMYPLSFKEYVSGIANSDKSDLSELYDRYILESGFPQTAAYNHDRQMIKQYLMDSVFRNTMQNDIAKRFGIKNQTRLEEILKFMFDNIGKESSLRNITGWLRQDGIDVSPATLNDYIKGALDSYLLHKCERWDVRGRAILQTNPKYYAADMGLRTALLGHPDSDYGRVLENIVYLELLRRGYEVYVGKIGNGEVDFIAQQPGGILEYYQVSWHILGNEKTIKREYSALEDIKDNYPKYLLTMDNGAGGQGGIKRQNVLKWLLGE